MQRGEIRHFVIDDKQGDNRFDLYSYDKDGDLYWSGYELCQAYLTSKVLMRLLVKDYRTQGNYVPIKNCPPDQRDEAKEVMDFLLKWDITESYEKSPNDPKTVLRVWNRPAAPAPVTTNIHFGYAYAMGFLSGDYRGVGKAGKKNHAEAPQTPQAPKECTCDIMTLMANGCQCGGA